MSEAINAGVAPVEAPVESQVNETEVQGDEGEVEGQASDAAKLEALQATDTSDMSKAEKKEYQALLKKFKIKVDGKEEDLEIDLNNEEELKKHLQMSKSANKRMQEAASLRKSAEQFIDMLKKDPRKVLSDPNIGVDLKTLAQEIINQELEDASKSPEQLERERLQRELEELKSKYEREEEERKAAEFERLQAEEAAKLESGIEGALKNSNLPKTPYTVRKMAEMMMLALENDIDLTPNDLVPLLRKQMQSDIKDLFSASNDDILEEFIGKDTISRLRKRTVSKVKQNVAQTANSIKSTGVESKPKDSKEEKKMSIKDFLKG